MIMDHYGNSDYSLEPSEHLAIPEGFNWSAPLKKLITAYETAYQSWSDAELKQIEAQDALANAGEQDKSALIEAVKNDKKDPGNAFQNSATRALIYAEEKSRQTATSVNALILEIKKEIPKSAAELQAQAIELETATMDQYAEGFKEAQDIVHRAEVLGRGIGTRINWLMEILGDGEIYRIDAQLDEVQWPKAYLISSQGARSRLDRLAQQLASNVVPGERVLGMKAEEL